MGLMDKLKVQAEQMAVKAQQGTAQVQAKFDTVQAKRVADSLLRDLGAAYYGEQRQSGPHDAVEKALAAVDSHAAQTGPVDVSTTGPQPTPTQAAPSSGPPPAGDFKLDDL
ncbi:MAG TPA: hypothetical protein VNH20_05025 [Candidatus Dormibacteraeota bacterium]|nr:hypothetical protein [Candidatus Dormibacteraeota bacterium]